MTVGIRFAAQPSTLAEQHQEEPQKTPRPGTDCDFLMSPKYLAWFGMMVVGVVLLLLKGINRWVRLGMLLVAFVLFGLDYIFMVHPSPMCGVTKLFTFWFTHGTAHPNLPGHLPGDLSFQVFSDASSSAAGSVRWAPFRN